MNNLDVGNITLHFNDDGSVSWSRSQPRPATSVVPPPDVADLPPQEFPPFPGTVPAPRGTDGPACEHGGMVWKQGTSEKTGKPWKGWFCSLKGSACKPVWS